MLTCVAYDCTNVKHLSRKESIHITLVNGSTPMAANFNLIARGISLMHARVFLKI